VDSLDGAAWQQECLQEVPQSQTASQKMVPKADQLRALQKKQRHHQFGRPAFIVERVLGGRLGKLRTLLLALDQGVARNLSGRRYLGTNSNEVFCRNGLMQEVRIWVQCS
jgi:hypothetical protein